MNRKIKILVISESVTLAHIIRPVTLLKHLDTDRFELHVASSKDSEHYFSELKHSFYQVTCLSSQKFKESLATGSTFIQKDLLQIQINEDLELLRQIKPDLVIGDFRISLNISARVEKVPYITLTNTHWLNFKPQDLPLPEIPIFKMIGQSVSGVVFNFFVKPFLPFILKHQARNINFFRLKYSQRPYQLLTDTYIDADIVGLCDTPYNFKAHREDLKFAYLGPICGDSTAAVPDWFENSQTIQKKKIYINLGSSGDHSILEKLLNELTEMDVHLCVGAPQSQITSLSTKYKNIFWGSNLPGSLLCRWADVILFNGGSPTTHQALLEGKPIVAICTNPDQILNMKNFNHFEFVKTFRNWNLNTKDVKKTIEYFLSDTKVKNEAQDYGKKLRSFDTKSELEKCIFTLISK